MLMHLFEEEKVSGKALDSGKTPVRIDVT